jgi:tetratricopeptide (TPR) repeat protein
LLVAVVAGVFLAGIRRPPRVVVVRWENMTGRRDLEGLGGRIMDALIRALGWREGFDVVSRQTVASTLEAIQPAAFSSPQPDVGAYERAARRLRATYLVSGSIEPDDGLIRLNCELTDLHRGVIVRSWTRMAVDPDNDFYSAVEAFAADAGGVIGSQARAHPRTSRSLAQLLTPSMDALNAYQRALEHIEMGDEPAACEDLRRALVLDSTFVDAHRLLANLSREVDESRRHYEAAMRYRASAAPVTRLLVEADDLWSRNQVDAAIDKYQKVLELDPEDVTARTNLAGLHLHRRRFEDAAAEFATLHQIDPYDYSFYPDWATAYVEIARDDRALGILRDWHRQFPTQVPPVRALIDLHQTRGDYETALALCDTLDSMGPGGARALRGFMFATLGRLRDAEALFRDLQHSPSPFSSRTRGSSYLAYLCSTQHRYPEGLALIDTVLRTQPEPYNFWIGGVLAAGNRDTLRAQRYARDIADQLGPGKAGAATPEAFGWWRFYYQLQGLIAEAEKRPDVAVQCFQQSVSRSSRVDSPFFRTDLARAWLEAGQPERAVQELGQVLEVNPRYPEALLYLGRAYVLEGRKADARSVLERLKTLWKEADADYSLNIELSHLLAATRTGG